MERDNENLKKKKKKSDLIFFVLLALLGMGVIVAILYVFIAVLVAFFSPTHYVSQRENIYGVWQNKYYEEYNNGKIRTTEEINRYYYKTKSGNTYYDNWTSYDISDITIIDENTKEYIVIERLQHKNELIQKYYRAAGRTDKPRTKAHYFIHKNTARKLGISVD